MHEYDIRRPENDTITSENLAITPKDAIFIRRKDSISERNQWLFYSLSRWQKHTKMTQSCPKNDAITSGNIYAWYVSVAFSLQFQVSQKK